MRKGPKPIFENRLQVKIRSDQRQSLDRFAAMFNVTVSDVVRWILDHGLDAIEHAAQRQETKT